MYLWNMEHRTLRNVTMWLCMDQCRCWNPDWKKAWKKLPEIQKLRNSKI